jgi:hypothetical protein
MSAESSAAGTKPGVRAVITFQDLHQLRGGHHMRTLAQATQQIVEGAGQHTLPVLEQQVAAQQPATNVGRCRAALLI